MGGRFNGLSGSLTSFVGRDQEVQEVVRLLEDSRLVTLTGPGGCGKSRLAEAVVDQLRPRFQDEGLWWAALAAQNDPAAVAAAVAEAVGLQKSLDRSAIEALEGWLSTAGPTLLICDNCEHLVEAVAELVGRLLAVCPNLHVLATSQATLGVPGEVSVTVPPLLFPAADRAVTSDGLREYEAVRLFHDRARAVAPGFEITEANAASVAQICRRLDGIPLAIELAAARVRILSPAQIAARLDDCFDMLVGGDRSSLPRHRAMEATIGWSYHLLPGTERGLLDRLSVFSGSCTIEAVEAIEPTQALARLSGLVRKSLVVVGKGPAARYRLLEPVRQYAAAKLSEGQDLQAVQERHARYFVDLAERADTELGSAAQSHWLDILEAERANFGLAMRWCLRAWAEGALRLATALWWFSYLRGHYRQGRAWLEESLHLANVPLQLKAKTLVAAGMLAHLECDYDLAAVRLEAGLEVYRTLDDRRGIATSLQILGSVARERGGYARCQELHEESLTLWNAVGDDRGVARSLNYLGFAAWLAEDHERARELCTRAKMMFQRAGDDEGIVWSLISLGSIALHQDDRASAMVLLQASLIRSREVGYREGVAWALNQLGILALRTGDHARAESLLDESLAEHRSLGDRWRMASVLDGLGMTAVACGDAQRGTRLLAEAVEMREAIGTPVPPAERTARRQAIDAARAALPEEFDDLWTEGRLAPLEQLLARSTATAGGPLPRTALQVTERSLRIFGFGTARVYVGQTLLEPADWSYVKPRELLYFLLSEADCTKEQIGAALWPWTSPTRLRNSFHTTLRHLRRALGSPDRVVHHRGRYSINRSLGHTYDVESFLAGLARAEAAPEDAVQSLTEAVGLYQGKFLADLPREPWIDERRSALRGAYEQALLTLGELHVAADRYETAVTVYQRAIAHDALLETAHRELIRCHARLGEHGRALRQCRNLTELLQDEFGASPSPQTGDLCAALRRGEPV